MDVNVVLPLLSLTSKHFNSNSEVRSPFKVHFLLVSVDPGGHGCYLQLSLEYSSVVPLAQLRPNFNLTSGKFPIISNNFCIIEVYYLSSSTKMHMVTTVLAKCMVTATTYI